MNSEIDKELLYGEFRAHERQRLKDQRQLDNKLRHMAMDVAFEAEEDPTKVNVDRSTTTQHGVGTKALLAVAAAIGLPMLGGMYMLYDAAKKPAVVQQRQPAGKTTTVTKTKDVDVTVEYDPPP